MSGRSTRIKPGRASLIGGIAVGIATFILWFAVTRELGFATPVWLVLGLLVSFGVATWIRVADL